MDQYRIPFRETETDVVDEIIRWFKFEPDDLFVDIGCGNGTVLEQIAQHVPVDCWGIEIDEIYHGQAIQRLRTFEQVKLFCGDLRTCELCHDRIRRHVYYLAWTKTYVDEFDFAKIAKSGDYLFVFKHPIPSMKSTHVIQTTPYNNLYVVYKLFWQKPTFV